MRPLRVIKRSARFNCDSSIRQPPDPESLSLSIEFSHLKKLLLLPDNESQRSLEADKAMFFVNCCSFYFCVCVWRIFWFSRSILVYLRHYFCIFLREAERKCKHRLLQRKAFKAASGEWTEKKMFGCESINDDSQQGFSEQADNR